jgi:hypothetical protein
VILSAWTGPPRRDTFHHVDSAIEVLGFLIGVSAGLFILITLAVVLPGRGRRSAVTPSSVAWFGGPGGSEHGVSSSVLALIDDRPGWVTVPETDWPALAEAAEPGRRTGGASAGW